MIFEKVLRYDSTSVYDNVLYNRAVKSSELTDALYEIVVFVANQESFSKEDILNVIQKYGIDFSVLYTDPVDQEAINKIQKLTEDSGFVSSGDIIKEIDLKQAFKFKKNKDE